MEDDKWMLNPAAVTCVTDPEPGERSPSEDGSNEDPLGIIMDNFDLVTLLLRTCIAPTCTP